MTNQASFQTTRWAAGPSRAARCSLLAFLFLTACDGSEEPVDAAVVDDAGTEPAGALTTPYDLAFVGCRHNVYGHLKECGFYALRIGDAEPRKLRALANEEAFVAPKLSDDGMGIVYTTEEIFPERGVEPGASWMATADGALTLLDGRNLGPASWSPDGSKLAYVDRDENVVRLVQRDGTGDPVTLRPYTSFPKVDPAGYEVHYSWAIGWANDEWIVADLGANVDIGRRPCAMLRVSDGMTRPCPVHFARDGRVGLFQERSEDGQVRLVVSKLDGSEPVVIARRKTKADPLVKDLFNKPELSRDLAYVRYSDDSGTFVADVRGKVLRAFRGRPEWSPTKPWLLDQSSPPDKHKVISYDGTDLAQLVADYACEADWTPAGNAVLYSREDGAKLALHDIPSARDRVLSTPPLAGAKKFFPPGRGDVFAVFWEESGTARGALVYTDGSEWKPLEGLVGNVGWWSADGEHFVYLRDAGRAAADEQQTDVPSFTEIVAISADGKTTRKLTDMHTFLVEVRGTRPKVLTPLDAY